MGKSNAEHKSNEFAEWILFAIVRHSCPTKFIPPKMSFSTRLTCAPHWLRLVSSSGPRLTPFTVSGGYAGIPACDCFKETTKSSKIIKYDAHQKIQQKKRTKTLDSEKNL